MSPPSIPSVAGLQIKPLSMNSCHKGTSQVPVDPRQASLEGGVGKGMEKSQNWQNGTLEKGINSLFLLKGYSWNHAFQV